MTSGAVLLLGNYGPSLAAARSLAAAGYRVIAGDGGEYALVARSRACHEVWCHPPLARASEFLDAFLGFLDRRPDVGVVLPLRPGYLEFLASNRRRLPERPALAMPDPETVLALLDKGHAYALAREVGVPHRPLHMASDLAQLRSAADAAGYPCVVRPASESGGLLPGRRKALICPDRGTLERELPVWPEGHATLVVQAYVRGPRHNLTFAARRGRILGLVQTRSLRTDRQDGTGVGVAGISVPADPRLTEPLAALVEHLGYEGVGLAQFLVPETGEPHFLELNPRLGTAMAFVESCGLDLAVAACRIAAGEDWVPRSVSSYPIGRRYAWTSRDLHGLIVSSSQGDLTRRDASRWLLHAARTAIEADVHLTWSLRDPMPTLTVFADLAAMVARRIARRTAA